MSFTLSIFTFSFASAEAQTNNAPVTGRLSKYTPLKAPFLRIGSRGQAVRDVQAVLRSWGFYNGVIDGS
ncbi:peptidoglycan-binding domain-containing protein [Nostoc piscinale]|uniref:peptidoglycan-binding domain-containing protein n=1 Tax=Nostoc piscinale TaxID=224012 RepID=UPI000A7A7C25|nr:hypothetical protein [Nostoc piscinale]